MIHPNVDRVPDQDLRDRVVGRAVDAGERHTAKPDSGDGQAALAEHAVFKL